VEWWSGGVDKLDKVKIRVGVSGICECKPPAPPFSP